MFPSIDEFVADIMSHRPASEAAAMTIAEAITEWRDDCPDWGDDGKRVRVLRDDGSEFEGVLSLDDFISNGEDEIPMFYVNLCSGEKTFLLEHEGWRFV